MKLQFIIRAKNKPVKRQHVKYNFLELEYEPTLETRPDDVICSFTIDVLFDPLARHEYTLDEMCQIIVEDWTKIEMAKREGFIFGLTNLNESDVTGSQVCKQSLVDIVKQTISSKFNDYTGLHPIEEANYLFTIDIVRNTEKFELQSFNIKKV